MPFVATAAAPLFARFTTDRKTIMAGEAFRLTLKIYIAGGNLDKQISITGLPAPADLQIHSFEELPVESATIEGQSYEVRPFRTWARAPHPDALTLAPRLDGTWIQTTRSFFFMQENRHPIQIIPESFVLMIRPLPAAGKPASFSGSVGNYLFRAAASPLDIAAGDLITVTLTVEGDWIPESFHMPQMEATPGVKIYDSKLVAEESSIVKQVYRQTVVPQEIFCTALPALSFCYFDTGSGTYKTLSSGPFSITYHAERTPVQPLYTPPERPSETNSGISTAGASAAPASSLSGWRVLRARITGSREIVLQGSGDISVRLAPLESSQELFTLKPGSSVVIDSSTDDWLRITCPKGIGWVRQQDVR